MLSKDMTLHPKTGLRNGGSNMTKISKKVIGENVLIKDGRNGVVTDVFKDGSIEVFIGLEKHIYSLKSFQLGFVKFEKENLQIELSNRLEKERVERQLASQIRENINFELVSDEIKRRKNSVVINQTSYDLSKHINFDYIKYLKQGTFFVSDYLVEVSSKENKKRTTNVKMILSPC